MMHLYLSWRRDSETWDNKSIAKEVGIPLCEGILAFENGEYHRAVEILYPLRYNVIKIGGSNAQVIVKNREFKLKIVHKNYFFFLLSKI